MFNKLTKVCTMDILHFMVSSTCAEGSLILPANLPVLAVGQLSIIQWSNYQTATCV